MSYPASLRTFLACTVGILVLLVALTFGAPGAWAQGVDNNAVFELDGNTQDNPAFTGLDWESTFPANTPITPNPIQDPAPQTIFTTGGSKDVNDVSQWRHKSGSVPDKDNILQAVAAALSLPNGNTAIYFAASRFDNSGDAQIGLWFFQQNVAPQPDGTFGAATHTDGDLLVLVNFEGGGLVPTIAVFVWQGGVNGGPVPAPSGLTTGECGVGPNAGNLDICAITNTNNSNAPAFWNYVPKSGTAGIFPPQSFFEGGVNLNRIFGANVPCFSSFLAETRSSSSITATLKDFAEGSFNLCKIAVTKNCPDGVVNNDGTAIQYAFSGTVTNVGAGAVFDVQVVDTPGNATGTQTPANPIPVAASLAPGASAPWSATFVTTAIMFTDEALAQAASSSGGPKTVTATATAPCKTTVSSQIRISKECLPGTTLVDIGDKVVVQVGVSGQVCNDGQTKLTGITLANDPATTVNLTSSTLNPGACTSWSASYQPADISSGDGTIPGRFFFDDVIRVTDATPALGDPIPPPAPGVCPGSADLACSGASCAICPPGSCSSTP
jgi:hypothetical protein